jgi:transcriptional regulator with XRE-family HTH domain
MLAKQRRLAALVGFRLKWARLCAERELDDVASAAGVTPALLRKIERGDYYGTLRVISNVAFALQCDIHFELAPSSPDGHAEQQADRKPSPNQEQ